MIEIKNLTKIYKTKKRIECKALNNINLILPEKGFVFIVGKSGSGKSTLLNMISGVDSFTSGEIIAAGNKFSKMSRKQFDKYLSSYIGFIFQDYRLIDGLTIKQNIELALDISGKKEDVSSYLEKVDLAGYENKYPTELSGGEKQRVAIVRALIKNPQVVLADEPTGNLDFQSSKKILDLLKEISKTKLVVIVSHNLQDANNYSDRIIELSDGKVINDKSRKNNYNNNFEISNNTLYLPHNYDLKEEEIKNIIDNKSKIKKIIQKTGGFAKTVEQVEESKVFTFDNKKISKENKRKLFTVFFRRKIFSKIFVILLATIIISLAYVMQSFTNFDSNLAMYHDMISKGYSEIIINKRIDDSTNRIGIVSESDVNEFKEFYDKKIYKIYNSTISSFLSQIDKNLYPTTTAFYKGYYCGETFGTLNCDEDLFNKKFAINGKVEVLAGNLYDKEYGIIITDYFADSILANNPTYTDYNSLIGPFDNLLNEQYINAIVKTNYKEKYNDLLVEIDMAIQNPDESHISEIYNSDEFLAFKDDLNKRLALGYNLSNNYEQSFFKNEHSNLITSGQYSIESKDITHNSTYGYFYKNNGKYDLKDNEIVMNYSFYNTIFKKSYKPSNLDTFNEHSMVLKFYAGSQYSKVIFEKEVVIKKLVTDKYYHISDELYNELIPYDNFCSSLYFDTLIQGYNILPLSKQLDYYIVGESSQQINTAKRVVDIFSSFVSILEYILIACCILYLVSFGVKNIKSNIYEISVIKSLGGSNGDIGIIFILQNIIVGIGILLLSSVGMFVASLIGNEILVYSFMEIVGVKINSFKIINYYISLVAIDLSAIILIIIISSILPTRFLRKVKPIEILKAKE